MRKKQVWRYWCDFCKKSGCSGGHMKRHELTCTANPNRSCRMCDSSIPPTDHLAILAQPGTTTEEWQEKMKALRLAVDNCPCCILAVIRQSGIQKIDPTEGPSISQDNMTWDGHTLGFDFKEEGAGWLKDKHEENASYY